jgi:phospholipid-translocating ATPase
LMCFFMPYLLYYVANFQGANGLGIDDRTRIGILVATSAVVASNTYILLNTYRWDWLTVLINVVSSLLIFFWTGVYSASTISVFFYKAAGQVYGALSFWVVLLVTVWICLLPRFMIKSIQKVFFPYDVDIIREQVTLGKFKYLDKFEAYVPPHAAEATAKSTGSDASATSSDLSKPIQPALKRDPMIQDDERPIYPPSIAPTMTTHNPRSQNGSNGTNYTGSLDFGLHRRPSWDPTTSERKRHSGHSTDYHGGLLARVESTNVDPQSPHSPLRIPSDPPSNPV